MFTRLQAEKEAREGQIAKLTARLQEMEVAQGHLAERNRLLETCLMINSPGSEQVCFRTACCEHSQIVRVPFARPRMLNVPAAGLVRFHHACCQAARPFIAATSLPVSLLYFPDAG